MKATVDAGAFFKALNRVIPLLKVSAIPALSEASIQFRDGICTITATDLELWVQADIPAEGDDFGVVLSGTKSIAKAGKFFRGSLTFSCADAAVSSPQIISRRETPTPASRKQPSVRCSEMAPYPAPAWVKNISWPLKPWRFTSPAAFPKIQKRRR